jgi:5'-nucleotidase
MKKPKVFVDMDDTALDYSKQWRIYRGKYPNYEYPQAVLGFFSTMEPMPGFMEAWHTLGEFYDMRFLTRPSAYNINSYTEKAIWVRDNMGGLKALEKLNECPDKSIVGDENDFLIDDFDMHGQAEFKGEFIQFGRGEFSNWEKVTNYLLRKAGVVEHNIK